MNKKIKVGFSCGDLSGIGIELFLKLFHNKKNLMNFTPILFGSEELVDLYSKIIHNDFKFNFIKTFNQIKDNEINIYQSWTQNMLNIQPGIPNPELGKYTFLSLKTATEKLKNKEVDILVTLPINKKTLENTDFGAIGHTEFLERELNGKSLMFMVHEDLKVGLLTNHIPLSEVHENLSYDLFREKLIAMKNSMIKDFAIQNPKIAVLSINPHAGDGGLIGKEDDEIISPILKRLSNEGLNCFGPYPADGFFGSKNHKNYDAVLAIYHDQGLIPFKAITFGGGVNFTAGLDKIRTSPDHGTAYDIVGKNIAKEHSLQKAIDIGLKIFNNRKYIHS